MEHNEHITQWYTVAVSPGCSPRQNNFEDVSLTVLVLHFSLAINLRKWAAFLSSSARKAPATSLWGCLMADLMSYNKMRWCLHTVWSFQAICGVTDWLTTKTRSKHMCTPPQGWGHWASLTFPSMIFTGQRCLLGEGGPALPICWIWGHRM